MEKGSRSTNRQKMVDEEDLEIKNVAYSKPNKSMMVIILVIFFVLMLITTIFYIYTYNKNDKKLDNDKPVLKINNDKNDIFIINNGNFNQTISSKSFEESNSLKIEKINVIELWSKKDALDIQTVNFNVRLNIFENDFSKSTIANNNSELLMRVSYSYNNEDWTYINNVLTTDNTTISPLMGNYYDIAGINSKINIATNYKLSVKPSENIKMYWKLEIIIKKFKQNNKENELNANFYLEYKDNN